MLITKSMCGADCYTDHKLIVSKLSLQILPKRRPQGQKVVKKMDIAKLKEATTKDKFVKQLNNGLKDIKSNPTDPEEKCMNLKNLIQTTAKDTLGPKKRSHKT